MIYNLGYNSSNNNTIPPEFTFSGKNTFKDEGNGNWVLYLYSNGILNFSKLNNAKNIDIFLVGRGDNGEYGKSSDSATWGWGGAGGAGGPRKTILNQRVEKNTNYTVKIETQSTLQDDKLKVNLTSEGGIRSSGGARTPGWYHADKAGAPGKPGASPFNNPDYGIYGGGGGAGHYGPYSPDGAGGAGGGASGGNAISAVPNTGGGGGGGYGPLNCPSGSGAIGLIVIRNHRK